MNHKSDPAGRKADLKVTNRKRDPKYTPHEKEALINFVSENKKILFGPFKSTLTSAMKSAKWAQITNRINKMSILQEVQGRGQACRASLLPGASKQKACPAVPYLQVGSAASGPGSAATPSGAGPLMEPPSHRPPGSPLRDRGANIPKDKPVHQVFIPVRGRGHPEGAHLAVPSSGTGKGVMEHVVPTYGLRGL